MKFCSACSAPVDQVVPDDDNRPRAVCRACATIHYQNPKNVVGCIVESGEEILLCRRAIEPRSGLWTIPAGYQELAESVADGALRETREEACAEAEIVSPHSVLDIPHIGQTYILFRAQLGSSGFASGEESLEVKLVGLRDIPWRELAFPVVHFALQLYDEDRRQGAHRLHMAAVVWNGTGPRYDGRSYELRDHRVTPLG